ncbi:MAG: DUF433 domain-containing protein [Nitrospirae bacterium]|nr:DUF433 domain-containing protein [Nitrospirota bacterium]
MAKLFGSSQKKSLYRLGKSQPFTKLRLNIYLEKIGTAREKKGTKISIALILQNIASGMTKEDILRGYPTLTKEGLNAALDFAASRSFGTL